jgi:hypothetical protein
MLVHGEASKMEFLKANIERVLNIPCYNPDNKEHVSIPTHASVRVDISPLLLHNTVRDATLCPPSEGGSGGVPAPGVK